MTQNHPFVDGNKRTGAQAADVFLGLNDIDLVCASSDFEEMIRRVARGELQKPGIAEFFRQHANAVTGE
ncbi:MAG: type II toxin-antitoxin system death-on-curing family toxin [Armatimonadota bacterium]